MATQLNLIVCAFVLLGSMNVFVSGDKCANGPAYWCSSFKNAKECGAFKHCIGTVWLNQKPVSSVKDIACDECEKVIKHVQTMLANKTNQDMLKKELKQICDNIPDIQYQCDQIIDEYFSEIIDMLVKSIDSKRICSLLGLCQGKTYKVVKNVIKQVPLQAAVPAPKNLKAGPQCVLCEFVIQKLDQMISDKTNEQEILAALDKVCSVLPSTIGTECKSFVDTYGPAILQLLAQEVSPSMVCTALGLCIGSEPKITQLRSSSSDCELCKLVINYLESILKKNASEQEIKQGLEKVCNFLPSDYASECRAFVDQYTPVLIPLLIHELDPTIVCQELKLCTGQAKKLKFSGECELCEVVISYIQKRLEQPATEEGIEKELMLVCDYIPTIAKDECTKFIGRWSAVLVPILVDDLNPKVVCKQIGACSSVHAKKITQVLSMRVKPKMIVIN